MNVSDLIRELQEYPGHWPVVLSTPANPSQPAARALSAREGIAPEVLNSHESVVVIAP